MTTLSKPEFMKLKKKDIRGKYKVNIDLRKLKGSLPLSKLKQEGRELLHCTPIHYSCGNNDEEFIKGNKENEKDKCCDCYPHKSCSVAKEVKGVLVQLEPFLTAQIEKAYLTALSDVEKGLPKEVKKPARYMLMAFHNGVAGYHLGEADNYKFHPFESIGDYEDYANGHEDFAQNNTLSAVKEVITKLKESK